MRKNRDGGFTLVEAIIVVAIIAILLLVLMGSFGGSQKVAVAAAKEHAVMLGWSVVGISCVGHDSDGDGYISCTVSTDGEGDKHLECDAGKFLSMASGCKAAISNTPHTGW